MTRYSLSSDSRRWWWPSAAAGTMATAVLAGVLLVPASGHDAPAPASPDEPSSGVVVERDRPCFLVRAHWNEALDGPQPLCSSTDASSRPAGALRPALSHLP
jgi:hypothetical protein